MGVPNVVYKWKSLRTLYVSVFVMNVAGCLIVVIMIVFAVKLRMGIGQYLDMVVPGNANFWPGMMLLIGFMCAPIYAIGIKLCFHLRFFARDSVPRLNQVLFIYCMLCFVSMIVMIGINTVGILHMINIHRINQNGIIESMQEYATEVVAKIRVDMIQINFQCCGSKSFKDWFHVRWMQKEGETTETKDRNESDFVSTDVPFSCCATEMLQPCIHHNILKPSEVYLYQPEHRLTIATTGCHAKVLNHARYVGGLFIVALILLAAYQMILGLLSRLLQTAYSNALYIGPRKGRYLCWILGSMPNTEIYDRLVYEGRDASADELVPLQKTVYSRLSELEHEGLDEKCQRSDSEEDKPLSKKYSESLDLERPSSTTVRSLKARKKSSTAAQMQKETSSSSTKTNSIPTPPPSPGTEDKSMIPDEKTRPHKGARKYVEERKRRIDGTKKKSLSRGMLPKVNGSQLKELRESLECLEKYQSPWRGGSPIFETRKPSGSPHQSTHDNDSVEKEVNEEDWPGSELERRRSSSTSSSDYKKYEVSGKDSIEKERDEMRMKKFCKDLSTEYKNSPYSKQRRDFSEEYKRQDTTHQTRLRDTDDSGRMIRNAVCAKFNPADTYSRFRGSVQDTMMRRSSQTQPGPPPIPISDQRTVVNVHHHCRQHQQYPEKPSFLGRSLPYTRLSKPRVQIGNSYWRPNEKQGWNFRCPPVPTYFPISSRSPRPPRLPSCPFGGSRQSHQLVQNQSRAIRPLQFVQNAELVDTRAQRDPGRYLPALQPPRFSGC